MASSSQTVTGTLSCRHCGGAADVGDTFCGECGKPLSGPGNSRASANQAREIPPRQRVSFSGKDARPTISRNSTNLWSRSERVRDELYNLFAAACQKRGYETLLLHSGPYVFPAWVRFEAWQAQGDASRTKRSSATVTIDPKPCHTHEFEFGIAYSLGNKTRRIDRVAVVGEAEVEKLIGYLLEDGSRPRFRVFREHPIQLWRPKNKIEGLRRDALSIVFSLLLIAGLSTITLYGLGLIFWAIAAFIYSLMRQRQWIVRNDGKPDGEPRVLLRMDSWQTVLFALGAERAMVRDRLVRAFDEELNDRCRYHPERVWYWGLDGKEEREQLVLTSGRGIVYCQIYSYGRDLYVGWDGHLNRGQWVEQTLASGIDKLSGNPVGVNLVVPGTQEASEYDLADLSCLMEWTHAQIVKLLRQLIAEKRIDQEIDFSIQRAERTKALATGANSSITTKVRKVFQRTG